MKQRVCNYVDTIYTIEDNIENIKKYFHFHQLEKEYNMLVDIQLTFRKTLAQHLHDIQNPH